MPSIDTLLQDIESIFAGEHTVSEENLDKFAQNCKEILKKSVEEAGVIQEMGLRMSNLGTPDRKLWYTLRNPQKSQEHLTSKEYIKFCYGHILEEFLLFLVRESGHEVTDEQREIEVDGVKGHLDCLIDGVPVDVKSASPYSFDKFAKGELLQGNDPFGYMEQISGYANALGKSEGAFLAFNKVNGDITLLKVPSFFISNTEERIQKVRKVLEQDTPPEKCYEDKPAGKGGNMKLALGCRWCAFKWDCWPEMRVFEYSNGPEYLTKVVSTPRVNEITAGYRDVMKGNTDGKA